MNVIVETWVGDWVESMKTLVNWMLDPQQVSRFQRYFGVKEVERLCNGAKGESFVPVDVDSVQYREWKRGASDSGSSSSSEVDSGYSSCIPPANSSASHLSYNSTGDTSLEEVRPSDLRRRDVIVYQIGSTFWHYVFMLGTQLGDETYYTILFGFWFWNIDSAVGRRLYLIFSFVMYIGQAMKDVIRWQRPQMPPCIQLESKWAKEYGMPSTHSMVGVAVPLGILCFTYGRYQYPFAWWAVLAVTWVTLVSTSRLYLGVHSVGDVVAGLVCGSTLASMLIPLAERSDHFFLDNSYSPVILVTVTVLMVLLYPASDRYSPAREDATAILGGWTGIRIGAWTTFQMGSLRGPPDAIAPPFPILWPTFEQYGHTLLRMAVGSVVLIATRAIFKPFTYLAVCSVLGADGEALRQQKNHVENKQKLAVNVACKLLTYAAMGFNMIFAAPIVFKAIGCERSTYFTEV